MNIATYDAWVLTRLLVGLVDQRRGVRDVRDVPADGQDPAGAGAAST